MTRRFILLLLCIFCMMSDVFVLCSDNDQPKVDVVSFFTSPIRIMATIELLRKNIEDNGKVYAGCVAGGAVISYGLFGKKNSWPELCVKSLVIGVPLGIMAWYARELREIKKNLAEVKQNTEILLDEQTQLKEMQTETQDLLKEFKKNTAQQFKDLKTSTENFTKAFNSLSENIDKDRDSNIKYKEEIEKYLKSMNNQINDLQGIAAITLQKITNLHETNNEIMNLLQKLPELKEEFKTAIEKNLEQVRLLENNLSNKITESINVNEKRAHNLENLISKKHQNIIDFIEEENKKHKDDFINQLLNNHQELKDFTKEEIEGLRTFIEKKYEYHIKNEADLLNQFCEVKTEIQVIEKGQQQQAEMTKDMGRKVDKMSEDQKYLGKQLAVLVSDNKHMSENLQISFYGSIDLLLNNDKFKNFVNNNELVAIIEDKQKKKKLIPVDFIINKIEYADEITPENLKKIIKDGLAKNTSITSLHNKTDYLITRARGDFVQMQNTENHPVAPLFSPNSLFLLNNQKLKQKDIKIKSFVGSSFLLAGYSSYRSFVHNDQFALEK